MSTPPVPALQFTRQPRADVHRRLLDHVRLPLHRDGYALAVNSGFTAATGLFYWILAARTYTSHAIGLNSALISSMMFLAGIAALDLPNILVRFLPVSGPQTRVRVSWAYAISAALALVAAAIFVIGVGAFSPRLAFLRANVSLLSWFLFSTAAWCLFTIQDSVLVALGRAVWVPVENAVFSLLKLVLLALLAALAPTYGIFVSWTIAMLASVVGVNVILFGALLRRRRFSAQAAAAPIRDRAFARYFAADYVCSVAWLSTANLMPVVVTAVAGATTNAYYALAYAVALPFYAFAQSIGTSLTLHGTRDPAALADLTRKATLQGARLLVPAVAVLVIAAPYLLALFGSGYSAHSATVLRLLLLASLPNLALSLMVAVARVRRRLGRVMIALSAETVLTLGLAVPLLGAFGVAGAGVAWAIAQCTVVAAVMVRPRGHAAAIGAGPAAIGSAG